MAAHDGIEAVGGSTDPLAVALEWAHRGFRVFPVLISQREDGTLDKRPAVATGFKAATSDPDEVRALFSIGTFPGTVMACGLVPGSGGFVVYDCDTKHGARGRELADDLGIPAGYIVTTPSGGEHRWCRKREDVAIGNASPWIGNIDVRADAGYVVAPGTVTPWGEWGTCDDFDGVDLAPEPVWSVLREVAGAGTMDLPTEVGPGTRMVVDHLVDRGATVTDIRGGVVLLARPGKPGGTSATVGALGDGVLYSFTSSPWPGITPHTPLVLHEGGYVHPNVRTAERARRWAEAAGTTTNTWDPIPGLAGLLANPIQEAVPSVLRREDGQCLLYAGEFNVLYGRSEAGKTWLAIAAMVQALHDGQRVLYADFEDTYKRFMARFSTLGFDPLPFVESGHLGYANPQESLSPATIAHLAASWDLVVIDSSSELVSANGGSMTDNSHVIAIYRDFQRLAAEGCTVVVIDHATVKANAGSAPATPMGASAKRNKVTGVEVLVENVKPLRGKEGMSLVYVTKDRPGGFGDDAFQDHGKGRERCFATLSIGVGVSFEGVGYEVRLGLPPDANGLPKELRDANARSEAEWQVLGVLERQAGDKPMDLPTIAAFLSGTIGRTAVYDAVTRLVNDGRLQEVPAPEGKSSKSKWVSFPTDPTTDGRAGWTEV